MISAALLVLDDQRGHSAPQGDQREARRGSASPKPSLGRGVATDGVIGAIAREFHHEPGAPGPLPGPPPIPARMQGAIEAVCPSCLARGFPDGELGCPSCQLARAGARVK
jgi:hypothetical protein